MNIIIVGLGRLGSGLAQSLANKGHQVTVVDQDSDALHRLPAGFIGRRVCGFAYNRATLLEAGIETADALIATTNSDEVNAVVSRVAKNYYRVAKVIARIYDSRKAEIYQRLSIQTIATTTWGIQQGERLLNKYEQEPHAVLGNGGVVLEQVGAPVTLRGQAVSAVNQPGALQIVAITRGGQTFIPEGTTTIELNDQLTVAVIAGDPVSLIARLSQQVEVPR